MDSYQFHRQATQDRPEAPMVTAEQLANFTDRELLAHTRAVMTWCAGLYLHSQHTDQILSTLDMTVTYNEATLPGSKTIVGLSGPNGAGKSTLARHWAAEYYREQINAYPQEGQLHRWEPAAGVRADLVPVVWTNLQANAKIAEVDAQILTFLRVGLSGTVRDMTVRAVRALARHRVRVLVIDDVHLLNLRKGNGRDVLDHLKHLNTEIGEHGGGLVLVGANMEETGLPYDRQIAARLRLQSLGPQPADSAAAREAWKTILRDLEPQLMPVLPAATPGFLEQHARLLHQRTEGFLGELVNVLKDATITATAARAGTLDKQTLTQAAGTRSRL